MISLIPLFLFIFLSPAFLFIYLYFSLFLSCFLSRICYTFFTVPCNYSVTGSRYSDCHCDSMFQCYATSNLNRYIRGNEYVQLLKPRQRLAKRGIDPLLCNVRAQQRFPKQRRCCCDNHEYDESKLWRESVIGQSSRRVDIKRSYSLASKEGRHKKFAANLKARSRQPASEEGRHHQTALRQDIRESESTGKEWV
jgi:hypothetical protein